MNKFLPLFIILFFSSFSLAQEFSPDFVPGEMYVMLKNDSYPSIISADGKINEKNFYENFGAIIKKENTKEIVAPFYKSKGVLKRVIRIGLLDTTNANQIIKKMNADIRCDYAEGVPMAYLDYKPNDLGSNTLGNQWHLYKIQAEEAWDISKGDKIVTVAIVDDALSINHPDLKNNVWVNPKEIPGNNIDDDLNGFIDDINGFDVGDGDNNPSPINSSFSHGTHVGGIVGATTDNNTGIASIGFNISLIGVKATVTGQPNSTSIPRGYEGIFYAAAAGANMINCSWSGPQYSATAAFIIQEAISSGSIILAAMGNDGAQLTRYPAAYTGVISVASTATNDRKSSFSNYAPYTTISAPGEQIRSTYTNNGYFSQSGTSMATPLVAGMLGLMKSHYPNISNEQLVGCMIRNVDDIGAANPSGYKGMLGAGRINAYNSLLCVDTLKKSPPEIVFEPLETAYCPNNPVQFNASSSAGEADTYTWEFPGGMPSSSNLKNPAIVYPSVGTYTYKLTLSNQYGQSQKEVKDGIEVSANGVGLIFKDEFETGIRSEFWTSIADNPARPFEAKQLIYNPGDTDNVAWVEGYNSKLGDRSVLRSMPLDFSDYKNVKMNFNFAYARRSSGAKDSLLIKVSIDGGKSFKQVYGEVMKNLNVSGNFGGIFTPESRNVWCEAQNNCIDFDLSIADSKKDVLVAIEYLHDVLGGNFYMDNVSIKGNCAKYENIRGDIVQVYPNPSNGLFYLSGVRGEGELEVYSASGQLIKSQSLESGIQELDLSQCAQGVYLLKWINEAGKIQGAKVVVAY